MRKIYLTGPTTAVLGLFVLAADTAPAFAGGAAAGYSLSTGVYLQFPSPPQQGQRNLLPARRNSAAELMTPCGGDFGMLGNIEAAQVAQANPTDAPVCE